ncbi:MAG: hypothetical protein Ct9H300mP11_18270 [Chloroflexota bacterium]|nr:MAG: hypothetical protein Ct9H300mP11_18270 [Chloroflexota bacterium]
MDFGLFLEFSGHENEDEAKVFQRGFDLIDEAEGLGIDRSGCRNTTLYR